MIRLQIESVFQAEMTVLKLIDKKIIDKPFGSKILNKLMRITDVLSDEFLAVAAELNKRVRGEQ
jgi:hypothetical protein